MSSPQGAGSHLPHGEFAEQFLGRWSRGDGPRSDWVQPGARPAAAGLTPSQATSWGLGKWEAAAQSLESSKPGSDLNPTVSTVPEQAPSHPTTGHGEPAPKDRLPKEAGKAHGHPGVA